MSWPTIRELTQRPLPPAARLAFAGALAATILAFAPACASAVSATRAIGWLNAQRAANGLPAGIGDNPEWNEGCRMHEAWLAKNPNPASPHVEPPGSPGYTTQGAFAGAHAVLAFGSEWSPSGEYPWGVADPWEHAPIHLMQLLAPELSISGFYPGCMITLAGYQRTPPPQPQLLTYPGNATNFIYPAESAEEYPFTPAQFVGLPRGGNTGPYLYVLAWGSTKGRLTAASLTGPSGPVSIRTVDDFTSGSLGDLGAYLPPGGMIIPKAPLAPATTYTASATFAPVPLFVIKPVAGSQEQSGGFTYEVNGNPAQISPGQSQSAPAPMSITWSFTTAGKAGHPNRCNKASRSLGSVNSCQTHRHRHKHRGHKHRRRSGKRRHRPLRHGH